MDDQTGKQDREKPEGGGVVLIEESRGFYRDGYRKILRLLTISATLNLGQIVIVALVIYSAMHVKPMVVAVNPSMQVQPVVPLSEPYVSDAGVSAWVTQALQNTMDISFSQWQQNLSAASKYYQPDAFKALIAGLKANGTLPKIVNNRLNTVLMPMSAAYVLKSGRIDGVPAWIVRGKFQITYQGATGNEATQIMDTQVIVQRASLLQHPSGLVIRSVVMK